ncbi:molecular chaperone TorD family protein [Gordonibacter sp. 28C]|uniref:molecular chaperone TorD family protein n=1 Tax=Gordonibacter sp. 28C TaxID=2078569 RepID=UPI001F545DFE|nr:molecular chaperone TorD family protein [Gordonibacter sp. 28C]
MNATSNLAYALSLIAPLFSSVTEAEYGDACRNPAWRDVRETAAPLACGAAERALALPPWQVRSTLQNDVLLPGMPLAALPVESLYKPWSAAPGNAFGAQRGLYLGDSARHIQAVCAALELDVPERYAAMPDHLSLLLDLLALFAENGNAQAAADLAADHFDWLDDYDAALARKADEAARADALDPVRRAALAEGVAHLRALVALTDALVRAVVPNRERMALS